MTIESGVFLESFIHAVKQNDIDFCLFVQKVLDCSGFKTKCTSLDEDGYEHCIIFANGACEGKVHTSEGKIVFIETV